jgi:uncharacterized membrane protein YbhN (UPF0104 family)
MRREEIEAMEEVDTAERRRNLPAIFASRWFRAGLGVLVVVVAFVWAIPAFASYSDVWSRLGEISASYATVLVVVGTANLLAPSAAQRAALPGLTFRGAVAADWTTSAITNTVPGGSAMALGVIWSMYRSFGLGNGAIARSIVVTGVWDTFVKFGTPLLALLWLSSERPVSSGLVQAAIIGGALFVVVVGLGVVLLADPATVARLGRLVDRLPFTGDGWPDRFSSIREETVALLRERWVALTFWTVAGHANLYLLLLVCLRAVGVTAEEATPAAVLAAFAFGRLITAIPLTPGGLGVMEVGLTGALAVVSTADEATVVAAVLLFRFMTFALPIPLGLISWLVWTSGYLQPSAPPSPSRSTSPEV